MDPRREGIRREGGLMAHLAAAFGSSHSVMLAAELQDWLTGFRQSDRRMKYYDREGNPRSYDDVLAQALPSEADRRRRPPPGADGLALGRTQPGEYTPVQ